MLPTARPLVASSLICQETRQVRPGDCRGFDDDDGGDGGDVDDDIGDDDSGNHWVFLANVMLMTILW